MLNITSTGLLFFLNTLIGLWITPFLINRLGVEVYGMIPLANQITGYLSLMTIALTGAVGRFLSIEIIKQNYDNANQVFNTTFFLSVAISLVLLPFIAILIFLLPKLINIPKGHDIEIQLLFAAIFLTFIISFLQTGFLVSSWALNRFDLRNSAFAGGKIVQVIILILYFKYFQPNIWYFSVSLLISTIFSFILNIIIWRKLTPGFILSIDFFEPKLFIELLTMGKWFILEQVGTIFLLSMDLLLVNKLISPTAGGHYGSLLIIPFTIRNFFVTVLGVISPIQMNYFTQNNLIQLQKISAYSVRMISIALAFIVGVICVYSKNILTIWLGPEFEFLWPILVLLVFPLFLTLPFQTLFQLQIAFNKVKVPAIITLTFGILNVVLIYLSTVKLNLDLFGIALACGITYSSRKLFFSTTYAAKIQNLPLGHYIYQLIPGLFFLILVVVISSGISIIIPVTNIFSLVFVILISALLSLLIGFITIFQNDFSLLKSIFVTEPKSINF